MPINGSPSPSSNVFQAAKMDGFYDFLHPLQTCTKERLSVYNTLKIFHFQDAFQDLHWGHAYTVAVSCWVVGNETCAAPAAAHVFGQCRACSCSHHMVSGQPFVPSRLSHLAVHGTIDRTIRRFWVDELWWTRFHIDFILLVRNSIVQTKLEVNLYLTLIEQQREGPVHVVAHVWIRARGIKIDTVSVDGYYFHPSYNPFIWVSLRPVLICLKHLKPVASNRTAIWMKDQTTVPITT